MYEVLPSMKGINTVTHRESSQRDLSSMNVFKKLILACTATSAALLSAQVLAAEEPIRHSGEFMYQKTCFHCHEANAKEPNVGPDLKGRNLPPIFTKLRVRQGWLAMPAFPASFIDDKTLDEIAEYVQNAPVTKKNP
ncbi:MAG: cytochrome c [Advenella sp.]|nr:cytochrome c [Advenella sp.]